jgi:glycosyltransferase involved in cell wall biosynthesis
MGDRAMKILMVTRETQKDKRYGLGRSLEPLIAEFRRRGFMVNYICQDNLGTRALLWQRKLHRLFASVFSRYTTNTDFAALSYGVLERLNMGRVAAKLAARHKHTHIHCHDPIIAAGFSFFSRFYPGHKMRWGVTEHGFGCYAQAIHEDGIRLSSRAMRCMRYWEARTLCSADWVVSPTRSAIEQVAHDLDISPIPATWHHIYHARPTINRYGYDEARQLLNWKNDVFYVLGVGRIAPVKQFPMLIKACAGLTKQSSYQLVILGEGDHDTLREMGKQLGLVREILFTTTEDIGLYLSAADLYVSTSASESFGLANLEAMVAGITLICTAVGGVPEIVGDGAILVPPVPEALTTAIQHLMEDGELRKTIAQNGRKRAEAWTDIEEIANQYETIYR